MSSKVYYRYNPTTDRYERVYLSRGRKLWTWFKYTVEFAVVIFLIGLAVYYWYAMPRERRLIEENAMLRGQLEDMGRRFDTAISVMDALAERDNNFYRVMMQAEPIENRYAGMARAETPTDDELVRGIANRLAQLERQLYVQSKSFDELKALAASRKDRITHIPSIQPISSTDLRQMASGYGRRTDPIYGSQRIHEGMDFASAIGTPVYATGDGVVTEADWNSGYGKSIDIDHGYDYLTRYAHLSEILVAPGQQVKRGDLIGRVGNTGKSTGSHLHYEVRYKNVPQNPVNYYFDDLTPEQYAEMIRDADNAAHVMD